MDGLSRYFNFLLFSLCLLSCSIMADDTCVKKSPCRCVFPNGTGIDLTPSQKGSFYVAQPTAEEGKEIKLSTYFFHPCFDIPLQTSVTVNNTCTGNVSLCRNVTTLTQVEAVYKKDRFSIDFLGATNKSEFAPDGSYIKFDNPPSATVIYFVCSPTEDQLYVKSLEEPNAVTLQLFSRNACLRQLEEVSTRSFGSTLCIIFFSFVIFYLVLGVATKKFLMGATGIEVIPNLAFWTDLPNLVKDGWAFAINGFKLPPRGSGPVTSPDPNSYDSI